MALWIEDFVIKNKFSRPAIKLLSVKGIVIHYTANNGGTAKNHADFFDGSDGGGGRYAGCHFFVDKNETRLLLPLNEVAYHANEKPSKVYKLKATASYYKGGDANLCTIGIEMCVEKDGSLHPQTVAKTEALTKELMRMYKLTAQDVYRHYDITGKNCPAMWVANPSLWTAFKGRLGVSTTATNKPATEPAKTVSKPVAKPKLLTVITPTLFTYKTADWNNKGQTVKKGEVFTIAGELVVKGSKMYKLKSGLFITANPKYVTVK